jgi:predicted amidohydrolase YtcJ
MHEYTKIYADIIFINGTILSVDKNFNTFKALAIKGQKILKVGNYKNIKPYIGPATTLFNLHGKTVLPGFIDSHIHFLMTLQTLKYIDLKPGKVRTLDDIIFKIKERAMLAKPDEWIIGFGWDQDKLIWPRNRQYKWPTRFDLDRGAPKNPVIIFRIGGHSAVVNSLALKLAHIDNSTNNPKDGIIDRFKNGITTGLLKEKAINLVSQLIPEINFTDDELERFCYLSLSKGLTNIEEANLSINALNFYKKAFNKGKIPIRVNALINSKEMDYLIENHITSPYEIIPKHLRICGVKFFADGGLGERTAALKEPYNDDPKNSGMLMASENWFVQMFTKAHKYKLQTATHAIGDLASEVILRANYISYNKLGQKQGFYRDRIEHCQVLSPTLIEQFKIQNIIASIQFSFYSSDKSWVLNRLGPERMKYAYAWNTLLQKGIILSGGTDSPVESYIPLEGIKNIVQDSHVTLEEALKLYTYNAAYASFQENYLGSLEPGKLADIVVLSKNILNIPFENISKTDVYMTLIDGKIVYK